MQQTIFITGASSGLGKATAKLFQSMGWKVKEIPKEISVSVEDASLGGIVSISLPSKSVK
jgi:hypothetical protein